MLPMSQVPGLELPAHHLRSRVDRCGATCICTRFPTASETFFRKQHSPSRMEPESRAQQRRLTERMLEPPHSRTIEAFYFSPGNDLSNRKRDPDIHATNEVLAGPRRQATK